MLKILLQLYLYQLFTTRDSDIFESEDQLIPSLGDRNCHAENIFNYLRCAVER